MGNLLFLNAEEILKTGAFEPENLPSLWSLVESSLSSLGRGESTSPLDLYLRPNHTDHFDRCIAKAGFLQVHGTPAVAGVKWIASSPSNLQKGLPRASGIIILNEPSTGRPIAILDAAPVNSVRTAALSIVALKALRRRFSRGVIFGAGVIGAEHLRQVLEARPFLGFEFDEIVIFDKERNRALELSERFSPAAQKCKVQLLLTENVSDCFRDHSAVVIATDALTPYLGHEYVKGKQGLSVLHVSLRDYTAEAITVFDHVVVDSLDHVMRENTSVDLARQKSLIRREDCLELSSLLAIPESIRRVPPKDSNVIINPMGLALYDLAAAWTIYEAALSCGAGLELPYSTGVQDVGMHKR